MGHDHDHAHDDAHAPSTCGCGHDHAPRSSAPGKFLASLAPVLACAFCPACLSTYAKVLAAVGVGVVFNERQHTAVLAVALTLSVVAGGWATARARRAGPLAVAVLGCGLIAAGHLLSDVSWLEWTGVLTLVVGGLVERRYRGLTSRAASLPRLGTDPAR